MTITIPGRPPTPNARRHWRVTALDNETWKGAARVVALASLPPGWKPLERCEMDVMFVFPTRGRHDWDNAIAAQKPVLDGIVASGAITDDSTTVITALRYGWEYRKGQTATVYTLTESAPGGSETAPEPAGPVEGTGWTPARIQRQRTKGWRMPPGSVYVGRPSLWGNPFESDRLGRGGAVEAFKVHIAAYFGWDDRVVRRAFHPMLASSTALAEWLAPLRDATALCCWCPLDAPCHADVLIELLA